MPKKFKIVAYNPLDGSESVPAVVVSVNETEGQTFADLAILDGWLGQNRALAVSYGTGPGQWTDVPE